MNKNVVQIYIGPEEYNNNFRTEEQLNCYLEMRRPDLAAKLFAKDVKFPGGKGKWEAMLWLEESFNKLGEVNKNRILYKNYPKPEPVQLIIENGMTDLFYSTKGNCSNRVIFFHDCEFPLIEGEHRPRGLSFKLDNGFVTEIFIVFDFVNFDNLLKHVKDN